MMIMCVMWKDKGLFISYNNYDEIYLNKRLVEESIINHNVNRSSHVKMQA